MEPAPTRLSSFYLSALECTPLRGTLFCWRFSAILEGKVIPSTEVFLRRRRANEMYGARGGTTLPVGWIPSTTRFYEKGFCANLLQPIAHEFDGNSSPSIQNRQGSRSSNSERRMEETLRVFGRPVI